MSYLNSVTLVGFVGSDPEQRQAKGNGSKFAVLSVATQRSRRDYMESESASTARVSLPTVSRGRELKFDVGFVLAIPERSLRRRRRRVPYRCGLPRFGDYFRIARQSGLGGTIHVRCHVFGRPRGVVIHSARSASAGLTAAARRAGR